MEACITEADMRSSDIKSSSMQIAIWATIQQITTSNSLLPVHVVCISLFELPAGSGCRFMVAVPLSWVSHPNGGKKEGSSKANEEFRVVPCRLPVHVLFPSLNSPVSLCLLPVQAEHFSMLILRQLSFLSSLIEQ